jgi:LuxR family maltose regulon positive regulatory protein
VEVRASDLAFTADEADTLMNGRMKLDLGHDEVANLTGQTEGWAAGLYLTALSVRGSDDRAQLLRSFDGSSRQVVDFLMDEVLTTHDPAMQDLMLRSSILERLCGPLLDAVRDNEGSGTWLTAISRTNLFLLPLDDRGEWYRFHHLFARLLRMELEHRDPGMAPILHRRAYAWFRDQGLLDEALEHAFEAGAFVEAGELLAAAWPGYMNRARHATVLAWLQRFPRQLVLGDSRLSLIEAWMQSMSGDRAKAASAVAAVEQRGGLEQGPLADGFSSLEAGLATLKAVFPWGDVTGGLDNAIRAAELVEPESRFRSMVLFAAGMGHYYRGQLEEADHWFQEAADLAPRGQRWLMAAQSLSYRSLIAGEMGRVDQQLLFVEKAVTLSREHGLEGILGDERVALGMSLVARGNLREALPLLERGVDVGRSLGQPLALANAQLYMASTLRAAGQRAAASSMIADAREVLDSCPDPGILRDRLGALDSSSSRRSDPGNADLTKQELAVLWLLRSSLSERDIGRELHLSHNTIHSHTRSIFRKLGVSKRADAVRRARELHLL